MECLTNDNAQIMDMIGREQSSSQMWVGAGDVFCDAVGGAVEMPQPNGNLATFFGAYDVKGQFKLFRRRDYKILKEILGVKNTTFVVQNASAPQKRFCTTPSGERYFRMIYDLDLYRIK